MRREVRIVQLSLLTSLKGNKKLVHVQPMLYPLEDFLCMVIRGDSSNALP